MHCVHVHYTRTKLNKCLPTEEQNEIFGSKSCTIHTLATQHIAQKLKLHKAGNVRINVTFTRVRTTITATEKQ